jgi:hypothetical protein
MKVILLNIDFAEFFVGNTRIQLASATPPHLAKTSAGVL